MQRPSGDARAVTVPSYSSPAVDAQEAQEAARRRRWRRNRTLKTESLRAQAAQLEHIALALPLLNDADQIWDAFLDDDTKRTRDALRQIAPVARELRRLRPQQQQLRQLLSEYKLASETLRELLAPPTTDDDWETSVRYWNRLARAHFRPWKAEQCVAEINAALIEAQTFTESQNKQSTGLSFMGWHDSRRVDVDASAFQFSIHKTYHGHDLDHQTSTGWRVYTDSALYTRYILGGRGRAHVDVLQQLTPQVVVLLYHERYDGIAATFHALVILATVETDDGVTQFIRSINAPALQQAFGASDDVWVSKFYWKQFDVLDKHKPRTQTDFRASLRGSIRDLNLEYVNLWLFEVLATLVRSEAFITGRSSLTF